MQQMNVGSVDPFRIRAPQLLQRVQRSLQQQPNEELRHDLQVTCDILQRSGQQDLEQISTRLHERCYPTRLSTGVLFSSFGATVLGLLTAIPLPAVGLSLLAAGGLGLGGSFYQHKHAHERLSSFNAAINHELKAEI